MDRKKKKKKRWFAGYGDKILNGTGGNCYNIF